MMQSFPWPRRLGGGTVGLLLVLVLAMAASPVHARDRLGPHPVPCSPAPCGDLGGAPLPRAPNGALEYPQSDVVSVTTSTHTLVLGQRMMITRRGHCDSSASNSIAGGSDCDFGGLVGLSLCPGAKPPNTLALTEHDGFTECYVATAPTFGWVVFTAVAGNCGVSQCTGGNYYEISANGATLNLAGHGHGRLSVDAIVRAFGHVTNARLALSLAPGDYLSNIVGARASTSGGRVTVRKSLGALAAGREVLRISADVASLFAGTGQTVHAMNAVGGKKPGTHSSAGWSGAAPAPAETGGNELIFSDSPEYLLGHAQRTPLKSGKVKVISATHLATGEIAGNQVEGILYKQTNQSASGDFRVYLNHENRTPVRKVICVVITPAGAAATELTQEASGEGEKPGDPVVAGERALADYEAHRRHPTSRTVTLDASQPAYVQCFGPIVNNGAAGVINAIIDYHSSGAVRIGVVAINSARKNKFESDPLGYRFADARHPSGDPSRTYNTDGPLQNPGETHVAGTFPYDQVAVNARADLDRAQPFGMLLAGNPKKNPSPGQYKRALDHGKPINLGNYGVFYRVTLTITGRSSEHAEIVFNPRGVGFDPKTGVTNAFAGIADVPSVRASGHIGREIHIPSIGLIKQSKDGTVLGTVHGGQTFSFDFMPPGGAVSPDAIVVLPEFVHVGGTLDFHGGSATGTPNPLTIALG